MEVYQSLDKKLRNSLHSGQFFMLLLSVADFFSKLTFFKNFFQGHYQCFKRFGSLSGSKLFAKVISRQQVVATVVPTKSDSDVIFCLQLLSKFNLYIPLELQ